MNKKIKNKSGFSLVELIVTISIFTFVTILVLANYPKFKWEIALKRTAQEIASGIRQAQVYGLGVREYGSGIFPGYGVYFDIDNPQSFILFADLDADNEYDTGEGIETFQIQTNSAIYELCGTSGSSDCTLDTLNIVYLRPYPTITLRKSGGPEYSDKVEIKIWSLRDNTLKKTITIQKTGLITVE